MLNIEIFNMTGIDTTNIDFDKSYTSFDTNTHNIIIEIYLKKDNNIKCDQCSSNNVVFNGSKITTVKTSTFESKKEIK